MHARDITRHIAITGVVVAATACNPARSAPTAQAVDADSLVLDRTVCFGFCPAYRLTIAGNGAVRFVTTARSDTVQRGDTISPRDFQSLIREAHRIGFFSLPQDIAADRTLCPMKATDHPTVTVTIFRADSAHQVVDYRGCYAGTDLSVTSALGALHRFESAVDSVAGSKRWLDLARQR
jgi:uncharacterized protein DUF6438